jgi:hypothetical protein
MGGCHYVVVEPFINKSKERQTKPRKTKPNQKSRDFCQMFVISKKKARTLRKKTVGLKVYGKSIA